VCALCKCIISLNFVTHVRAIAARDPQKLGGRFTEPLELPVSTPLVTPGSRWKCHQTSSGGYNMAARVQATSRPPAAPQLPTATLNDSLPIGSQFSTTREELVTKAESVVPSQTPAIELVEPCWLDVAGLLADSDSKPSLDNSRSSTDEQSSCSEMPVRMASVESDIRARSSSWTKRLRSARSVSRLTCSNSDIFFSVSLRQTLQLH